jgi:hypothetical protein
MKVGIKIHCSALPWIKTEHDGRWLKFYDPTHGKHGRIVSTDNPAEAKHYDDREAAFVEWHRSNGLRPDGRPNRPLTAWTVSIETLPEVPDAPQ